MKIGLYTRDKRGGPYTRMKAIVGGIKDTEIFTNPKEKTKYDLLHLHWQITPSLLTKPFIQTFHGWLPLKYCTNLQAKLAMIKWKVLQLISLSLAKKIICVSNFAKKLLPFWLQSKITVVRAGIPVKEYREKKKEKKILFLNSLEKYENALVLIKAIKELGKKDIIVKIFGEGRQENMLKKMARGIPITFYKEVDNAIIKNELATAKIVVQPALQETFGFPVIEAMASGCIPIISDIESHRECFKNVVFFPSTDYMVLKEKIEMALAGKFDYLVPKAKKEAMIKYDNSRFIKETKKVYDDVISIL